MTCRIVPFALLLLAAQGILGQNLPPVVIVGEPREVGTLGETYLEGDVSDPDTPLDSLQITWKRLSGPASVVIVSPSTAISLVEFSEPGTYVFELTVRDGVNTVRATTILTVRESLPFMVLQPTNGASVPVGKPYLITWQMDPSKPCRVSVSWDDGATWELLTGRGAVSDSFVWEVDPKLTPGTKGLVEIAEYGNYVNNAEAAFVLEDASAAVYPRYLAWLSGHVSEERGDRDISFDPSGRACAMNFGKAAGLLIMRPVGGSGRTSALRGIVRLRRD